MVYKVVRYLNNPILERPAAPITKFDTPELHTLVEDMFETMYASHGIGLAAPQIDVLLNGLSKCVHRTPPGQGKASVRNALMSTDV